MHKTIYYYAYNICEAGRYDSNTFVVSQFDIYDFLVESVRLAFPGRGKHVLITRPRSTNWKKLGKYFRERGKMEVLEIPENT